MAVARTTTATWLHNHYRSAQTASDVWHREGAAASMCVDRPSAATHSTRSVENRQCGARAAATAGAPAGATAICPRRQRHAPSLDDVTAGTRLLLRRELAAGSRVAGKNYQYCRQERGGPKTGLGSGEDQQTTGGKVLPTDDGGLCLAGQYLKWTKNSTSAQRWWCPHKPRAREHLFKNCPQWKRQQKILWAGDKEGDWLGSRSGARLGRGRRPE